MSNNIYIKGLTGVVGHKWREIEHGMILEKHSSVLKYKDVPFPDFILVRRPCKEPKVQPEYRLPELEENLRSLKNVVVVECAEQDSPRIRTAAKQWAEGGGLTRLLGRHAKMIHLNYYGPRKDDMEGNIERTEDLQVNRACHIYDATMIL